MEQHLCRSREELNDLRKEYRGYSQVYLDKCFSYLNFYAGLLFAILGATLTGLLNVRPGDLRALLLLAGPVAVFGLALLAYRTIEVFYRRSTEAWVARMNLEAMLGTGLVDPDAFGRPVVPSQSGGWLPRFERPKIKEAVDSAPDAEKLVLDVTDIGDTLGYARRTLWIFACVAGVFSVANLLIATR